MSTQPTLHHTIRQALIARFQTYALDTRLPSDRELAREYGVAFLTINRVMRDLAAQGYVVRRPRQGTFLTSRDRVVAGAGMRPAASGGTARGAVVFAYPNVFSRAIWRRLRHAEEWLLKAGRPLVECKLSPHSTAEHLIDVVRDTPNVAGTIWMPVPDASLSASVDRLLRLGKPVALLSGDLPPSPEDGLYTVDQDWRSFGQQAAGTLLDAGHRAVALVASEVHDHHSQTLVAGIRRAYRDRGLDAGDFQWLGRGGRAWRDNREVGYQLTRQLLAMKTRPTAAVFESLNGVRGAMRALWERGERAPEALSVVASGGGDGDDVYFAPPLTTLDADVAAEINTACALVTGALPSGEGRFLIPPCLTVRESVRAPAVVEASPYNDRSLS